MFDLFLVGQSLGVIDVYFEEEANRQDFWTPSENMLKTLKEDGRWFMVNPQKLKEDYRKSTEVFIVTEEERDSLLKGFALLHKYSNTLPDSASLEERVLMAKEYCPPVFFELPKKGSRRMLRLVRNDE